MIAHIIEKPSRVFSGVKYNTNKVDRNKGELMLVANFGILQALSSPRPQDLINYLKALAAQNKAIKNSQFHAVISGRGRVYNKDELTRAAVSWLREMGYDDQPYLIVYHKDTDHNHVHMVTSRIDRNGKRIDRDYEQVRAVRNIDKVLGYSLAMQYNLSTKAQFYLILERLGYLGRDYMHEEKLQSKLRAYRPDPVRAIELKELFWQQRSEPDFIARMKNHHQVDVVLHASEGKKPYGYSVIDHQTRQVFKGSEILSLKYLLPDAAALEWISADKQEPAGNPEGSYTTMIAPTMAVPSAPVHIGPVYIADDVDDQQVLGMKRRRQKKARTNTR